MAHISVAHHLRTISDWNDAWRAVGPDRRFVILVRWIPIGRGGPRPSIPAR